MKIYRTQKANGIYALQTLVSSGATHDIQVPSFICKPVEDLKKSEFYRDLFINKFVRPCPVTPRHGFVDSRLVTTPTQLSIIIGETIDADPEAEMIAMDPITAVMSGIWTPGQMTLGGSNDGATSGRDSTTIPILGELIPSYCLKDAGVADAPYVELVWSKQSVDLAVGPSYVQLRNGPKLPQTVDFIPGRMEVKRLMVAKGDLLEWETKMKKVSPGTVVYHPGGSLASHYAVHAVLNNIPVMVSRKPEVGETLVPTTTELGYDLQEVKRGFVTSLLKDKGSKNFATMAYLMLVGCHSTAVWRGKADFLLGYSLGCSYKLLLMAGIGEARHYKNYKLNGTGRTDVYNKIWRDPHSDATRALYVDALNCFKTVRIKCGYGGILWYQFTAWAGRMYNALADNDVTKALECMNQSTNCAHNNGWGFNKFLGDKSAMDKTAKNPAWALSICGPMAFEAYRERAKSNLEELDAAVEEFFSKPKFDIMAPDDPDAQQFGGCGKTGDNGYECMKGSKHTGECKDENGNPLAYVVKPTDPATFCCDPDPQGYGYKCALSAGHAGNHKALLTTGGVVHSWVAKKKVSPEQPSPEAPKENPLLKLSKADIQKAKADLAAAATDSYKVTHTESGTEVTKLGKTITVVQGVLRGDVMHLQYTGPGYQKQHYGKKDVYLGLDKYNKVVEDFKKLESAYSLAETTTVYKKLVPVDNNTGWTTGSWTIKTEEL